MFYINFKFNDVSVSSIEKKDIDILRECDEVKNIFLNIDNFEEKFLEYYIGEGELFLKICKNDKVIGTLRGRIEFKNPNELWMLYFFINENYTKDNLVYKVMNEVQKYFSLKLGINIFYTIISIDDRKQLKFWKENGFELFRIMDEFITNNRNKMVILKKEMH